MDPTVDELLAYARAHPDATIEINLLTLVTISVGIQNLMAIARRQKTPEGEAEKDLIVKRRDVDGLTWQKVTTAFNKGRRKKLSLHEINRIYRREKTIRQNLLPNSQVKKRPQQSS